MLARRTVAAASAAAALLVGHLAHAEGKGEVRVAVVDMQRAIIESNEGARANHTIKVLFDKRQVELDQKQEDLLKEKNALEQRCKAKPDPARCQSSMEDLQRKLIELQNLMMQYQQEIQKKQGEATQPILNKMLTVVRRIAQRDGYDMVVDRAMALYQRPEMDVTDIAIKMYNAESSATPLTPAELKELRGKEGGDKGDKGGKPRKGAKK